jgi:RimJ/RimL family protein N-acetyltransferase
MRRRLGKLVGRNHGTTPIILEPFTEADIDQLVGWIPSPEFLAQWTGAVFDFPLDRVQLTGHLVEAKGETPTCLIYKAVNAETGQAIGHGELVRIDSRNLSAALARILIGPPGLRGGGLGQALVKSLLRVAFEDLSLHRVALNVFDFNHSALRCYQKVGFKQEAVLRDACKVADNYWNVYVMSILEHEYQA